MNRNVLCGVRLAKIEKQMLKVQYIIKKLMKAELDSLYLYAYFRWSLGMLVLGVGDGKMIMFKINWYIKQKCHL